MHIYIHIYTIYKKAGGNLEENYRVMPEVSRFKYWQIHKAVRLIETLRRYPSIKVLRVFSGFKLLRLHSLEIRRKVILTLIDKSFPNLVISPEPKQEQL